MNEIAAEEVRERLDTVFRLESRRILATLIRLLGGFDLAEDALHDAFRTALEQWQKEGVSFGKVLRSFAATRQVIAFEQQGHGHTADIVDRPFTFEQSADDTAGLLRHLNIRKADFFGYSNGGHIALQMAISHPDRVRKLVIESVMFDRDGSDPWFWKSFEHAKLDDMPPNCERLTSEWHPIRKICPRFSPRACNGC
jgi:pimeloyl-ACP methyl ester carboxylesterase